MVWMELIIPSSLLDLSHIFNSLKFTCMIVCLNTVDQNTYCS